MRIQTNHLGYTCNTTLDDLLEIPTLDLYHYWVVNPAHRDFFEGYLLVKGLDVSIKKHTHAVVITFLDL